MNYTIDKSYYNLIEIKKSKFFTYLFPVSDVAKLEEELSNLRKKYNDATHICYAYVLSSPNLEKCSDDGEPDGTAGKPMLDIIKKNNLTDVLLVVIRYFGGIKLGAGGLIRAYAGSGNEIIKLCKMGYKKEITKYEIECKINDSKKLLEKLRKENIEIVTQEYGENFKVQVLSDNLMLDGYKFVELEKTKVFYDKD